MAFGIGFGMAQRTNIIAAVVPTHEIGIASSVLALARNIAGAFGIAVFGTLLTSSAESNVLSISRYSSFHGTTQLQHATYTALIALKAQINAYHTVFYASASVLLLGAVLSLFISNVEMREGVQVHVE
jgi:hypothetical protein